MPSYEFDGLIPVVDPTSFVHPTAVLIGDVHVGKSCYIGPFASLRGDFGRIAVGAGSNVQDGCILHSFPGADCVIEEEGHIGHGAVLHGCRIGPRVLVGIKAVVMDEAEIGEDALIGAMSFIKSKLAIPPGVLAMGNPARVVRPLTQEEIAWKKHGLAEYQELAEMCLQGLREQEPLIEVEEIRVRKGGSYRPLFATRKPS